MQTKRTIRCTATVRAIKNDTVYRQVLILRSAMLRGERAHLELWALCDMLQNDDFSFPVECGFENALDPDRIVVEDTVAFYVCLDCGQKNILGVLDV